MFVLIDLLVVKFVLGIFIFIFDLVIVNCVYFFMVFFKFLILGIVFKRVFCIILRDVMVLINRMVFWGVKVELGMSVFELFVVWVFVWIYVVFVDFIILRVWV